MYDPYDHYWQVSGGLFSSARQIIVQAGDAQYRAWRMAGNLPTGLIDLDDLREVLAPYNIGLSPQETEKLRLFGHLANRPHLLASAFVRLLGLLAAKGVISGAEARDLIETDHASDPEA